MHVNTGSLIVAFGLGVWTFAPIDAGAVARPPSDTKQGAVVQAVDAQSPSSSWKKRQAANAVPGDIDGDGIVGVPDLLHLLGTWGACPAPCPPTCPADIDQDCMVAVPDLLILLANWG